MEHVSQHEEAVRKTIRVENKVECAIHDDKVKECGSVSVTNGRIVVSLHYVTHMMEKYDTAAFLADTIGGAVRQCFMTRPECFEPNGGA